MKTIMLIEKNEVCLFSTFKCIPNFVLINGFTYGICTILGLDLFVLLNLVFKMILWHC